MKELKVNVNHLKFDNEFNIEFNNKSMVIYGCNGMGKSSMFNEMKKNYKEFAYLEYYDMKEHFIKKKDNNINVTPHAQKYYDLIQELEEKKKVLSLLDRLKEFEVNSIAKAKISPTLSKLQAKKQFLENITITNKHYEELAILEKGQLKFILKNLKELKEISDINEDIEISKKEYLKQILVELEEHMDSECDTCPVCGNQVIGLKQRIVDKIKTMKKIQNKLLEKFTEENKHLKNEQILDSFEKIIDLADVTTEKDIVEYMMLPSYSHVKHVNEALAEIKKLDNKIAKAEKAKVASYNALKKISEEYTAFIRSKFNANVTFDDNEKTVVIKLERHPREYSTGEFNIILFTTHLFEFLGGDKKIMILDDPISSYDIVNQYKIVFDLLVNNNTGNKNFIIFTHNMSLINMINSQQSGVFEYKMLDRIDGIIHMYNLNSEGMDSILSVDNILKMEENNSFTPYVRLVMERDKDEIENVTKNTIHELFHYDGPYKLPKIKNDFYVPELTNDSLVEVVNNASLENFDVNNYSNVAIYKITLMIGLRVWIEKKLYDVLKDEQSYPFKEGLKNKIDYALPRNNDSRVSTTYPNLKRTALMSKRVMLNQHGHYKSQGEPFYYVMNLSVDDILQEIKEVKELFI